MSSAAGRMGWNGSCAVMRASDKQASKRHQKGDINLPSTKSNKKGHQQKGTSTFQQQKGTSTFQEQQKEQQKGTSTFQRWMSRNSPRNSPSRRVSRSPGNWPALIRTLLKPLPPEWKAWLSQLRADVTGLGLGFGFCAEWLDAIFSDAPMDGPGLRAIIDIPESVKKPRAGQDQCLFDRVFDDRIISTNEK